MPQFGLQGKTVMIATPSKSMAEPLEHALEELGAKVVFSQHSPHNPKNISMISKEVEKNEPKIDAFIIHSAGVELRELQTSAVELTKRLKKSRPVIIYRVFSDKMADIQPIQDAGAKYFDYLRFEDDQVAYAVADAVAKHGKPQRKAAV